LVSVLYVLHIIILHLLRNDGCCNDSKPPHCCHSFLCILWNMEPILRVYNSSARKCFTILSFQIPNFHSVGLPCGIILRFIYVLWSITEHAYMVEMVLLGLSNSMDLVWIGCITVWRYTERPYRNSNSERICEGLFWFRPWFSWSSRSGNCWVDCPLCFHICLCYQGFQLPEAIEILFTHTHTYICFYFFF